MRVKHDGRGTQRQGTGRSMNEPLRRALTTPLEPQCGNVCLEEAGDGGRGFSLDDYEQARGRRARRIFVFGVSRVTMPAAKATEINGAVTYFRYISPRSRRLV
jgi:hypothetical protein